MKLKEIKIENFRGVRSLHLPLDGLTVIIGENNTGKSTVLEAIRLVLTRGFGGRRDGRLNEYDFHLKDATATPHAADPISIKMHFAEEKEGVWPETIIQQMNEVIQYDVEGLRHIWLQAKGSYQAETGLFETQWFFLDMNSAELMLRNATPINLITRFVPLFFLSALRDASKEFGQQGQFWSGFLKSIKLPKEKLEEIEESLREANKSLINSNAGLAAVIKNLAEVGQLVTLDSMDPVVLEAIPTRVFDMTGKILVHLKTNYGVKLPMHRHGEGTQSLAVLMLFQAFAAVNLAAAYAPESTPVLALEEPEAHLHPSAIRSLGTFLKNMTGQILVTSHSGDLVSRVPVTALRRLYKQNDETQVGRIENGTFTGRELQAIQYSICLDKGHYLFSRCWLLVEGESEYHLMLGLFELMGYTQDQISFSILEVSQVVEKGECFIKFAKALGIQWFLMSDGDRAGRDYVKRATSHLAQGESLLDRARKLPTDIEHEFWNNGYDDFILKMVLPQTRNQIDVNTAGDKAKRIKRLIEASIKQAGGKPAFAQALIQEIRERGAATIPQTIREIIDRVVQLAGG
jgi:putative ATP-dependent endonuclease of OLD family